jgi:hypothetical protein
LHSLLRPGRYEDAPHDFVDVCHLRSRAYPKVAKFVGDELAPALPPASQALSARVPKPPRGVEVVTIRPHASEWEPDEDLRQNIYPLW